MGPPWSGPQYTPVSLARGTVSNTVCCTQGSCAARSRSTPTAETKLCVCYYPDRRHRQMRLWGRRRVTVLSGYTTECVTINAKCRMLKASYSETKKALSWLLDRTYSPARRFQHDDQRHFCYVHVWRMEQKRHLLLCVTPTLYIRTYLCLATSLVGRRGLRAPLTPTHPLPRK